jgi:hypothetical protein
MEAIEDSDVFREGIVFPLQCSLFCVRLARMTNIVMKRVLARQLLLQSGTRIRGQLDAST